MRIVIALLALLGISPFKMTILGVSNGKLLSALTLAAGEVECKMIFLLLSGLRSRRREGAGALGQGDRGVDGRNSGRGDTCRVFLIDYLCPFL